MEIRSITRPFGNRTSQVQTNQSRTSFFLTKSAKTKKVTKIQNMKGAVSAVHK